MTLKIKFDPPKGQTWHELIHFSFNIDIIFNLRHWSPKLNDFKTFEGHPILDQLRGRQTLVNIYSVIECWASIKFTKIVTKSRVFLSEWNAPCLYERVLMYTIHTMKHFSSNTYDTLSYRVFKSHNLHKTCIFSVRYKYWKIDYCACILS